MSVQFTILGSGSSGNCAYVETAETRILVDAGFSPLQIRKRLATIGKTPENLSAILLTHEHSDHIAGILGLAEKLHVPVFCNRGTQDGTIWALNAKWTSRKNPPADGPAHVRKVIDWRLFETGARGLGG